MIEVQKFELLSKNKLTNDIYEMEFNWDKEIKFLNWQFITFLLPKIWWRAYSILKNDWKKIVLIIKKREKIDWWRWWSKFICELEIWDVLKWVWPAWDFTLKKNNNNKLFLWTWTWFVPLYNQIKWALQNKLTWKICFIFWVRNLSDVFYENKLKFLKTNFSNFDYKIYLSRENKQMYNYWYITQFLTQKNIKNFEEFYICWTKTMIDGSKNILNKHNVVNEKIFTEKY